jgi:hypothetical protein
MQKLRLIFLPQSAFSMFCNMTGRYARYIYSIKQKKLKEKIKDKYQTQYQKICVFYLVNHKSRSNDDTGQLQYLHKRSKVQFEEI